jgi:hypothetical protein
MSEHTPGPLRIGRQSYFVAAGARGRTSIAHCIWTGSIASQATNPSLEQAEANARLIAAAPELLAACEEFVSKYSADASIMLKMKAAIAKAKGEPDAAS